MRSRGTTPSGAASARSDASSRQSASFSSALRGSPTVRRQASSPATDAAERGSVQPGTLLPPVRARRGARCLRGSSRRGRPLRPSARARRRGGRNAPRPPRATSSSRPTAAAATRSRRPGPRACTAWRGPARRAPGRRGRPSRRTPRRFLARPHVTSRRRRRRRRGATRTCRRGRSGGDVRPGRRWPARMISTLRRRRSAIASRCSHRRRMPSHARAVPLDVACAL